MWVGYVQVRQMEAEAKHDLEVAFNEKDPTLILGKVGLSLLGSWRSDGPDLNLT